MNGDAYRKKMFLFKVFLMLNASKTPDINESNLSFINNMLGELEMFGVSIEEFESMKQFFDEENVCKKFNI
jgi:hypothetical protein